MRTLVRRYYRVEAAAQNCRQKIFKIDKNVIARSGFDDYYKKFSCKD